MLPDPLHLSLDLSRGLFLHLVLTLLLTRLRSRLFLAALSLHPTVEGALTLRLLVLVTPTLGFLGFLLRNRLGVLNPLGDFKDWQGSGEKVLELNLSHPVFFSHRLFDLEVSVLAQLGDILEKEEVFLTSVGSFLATDIFSFDSVNL